MNDELIIPASIMALLAVGAVIAFLSNCLGNFVSCKVAEAEKLRLEARRGQARKR